MARQLITFLIVTCLGFNYGYSQSNEDRGTPVKVAVVQQNGNPGKVEENRAKAVSFAKEALALEADVILFHEELLVGYSPDIKKLAEPINGESTQAFKKVLQGTDALIIYGLTEKDGDQYYISAVVVSREGVVAHYRKTHLWSQPGNIRDEPAVFTPGNELETFKVKGYLSGLMICYDGDFPEMTRSYANMGCSMVFWLNNCGSRENAEAADLARRNSMILPVANCTGPDEAGYFCKGGSKITGPRGEILAEIWSKEGVIVSDVYPATVAELRKNNSDYTGLRPDLYYYDNR